MKLRTKTNIVLTVFFLICAVVGFWFGNFWSTAFGMAAVANVIITWIPGNKVWRDRQEPREDTDDTI